MEIVFDHNLDDMDFGDRKTLRRALRKHSAQLHLLADYCENKQAAVNAREKGQISIALIHEECCDEIYQQLLPRYQW